jgi:hypothetical protein
MESEHYILVDYENVQGVDLDLIAGKPVKVILVLGKKQTKVPIELVTKLINHSSQVQVVETEAGGRNALDFVLACVAGEQSSVNPGGSFSIISRDQGFEALVLYLRRRHKSVERYGTFQEIPLLGGSRAPASRPAGDASGVSKKQVKGPTTLSLGERASFIRDKIAGQPDAKRPKRPKALLAQINTYFGNKLTTREIQSVYDKLLATRVIEVTPQGALHYNI